MQRIGKNFGATEFECVFVDRRIEGNLLPLPGRTVDCRANAVLPFPSTIPIGTTFGPGPFDTSGLDSSASQDPLVLDGDPDRLDEEPLSRDSASTFEALPSAHPAFARLLEVDSAAPIEKLPDNGFSWLTALKGTIAYSSALSLKPPSSGILPATRTRLRRRAPRLRSERDATDMKSQVVSDSMQSVEPQLAWWQKGLIYQIYPMSFQDSNGDGCGDLQGVIRRLDYLESLSIDALWLSPIFASPMHDNGYDVSDYKSVHPQFGDLSDFDRLLEQAHRRGIKVLLDLVPNHTSDEHAWFVQSRSSRDNPKRDWYIWRDPAPDGGPPNNWISFFGGPAWTFDESSGQYYMHQFDTHQPELNYRHPQVLPAVLDVMRFWLDRGVDGYRIDTAWLMMKDERFRNEPPAPDWDGVDPHESLIHTRTQSVEGIHGLIRAFRREADRYGAFLVGEIYLPLEELTAYYGQDFDECHLPFNFHLIHTPFRAGAIRRLVERYEACLPAGAWPCWVNGNHDKPRTASRVGAENARLANLLLLTLRGTPTVYYGEELGMPSIPIRKDIARDPIARRQPEKAALLGRDQSRTPMQWDDSPQGGFTSRPQGGWLPLGQDWRERNVACQQRDPTSELSFFRQLASLRRREPALHGGGYESVGEDSDQVFCYRRFRPRADGFIVCLNFSSQSRSLDLSSCGERAQLELSTLLSGKRGVQLKNLNLAPREGVLLRLRKGPGGG